MASKSPWAILLCKFNGTTAEPYPVQRYRDLFTKDGVGKFGMVDFFDTMSHGSLDLTGSQLFGWLTLAQTRDQYLGRPSRGDIVTWARTAAATAGLDLTPFVNVVVVMNVATDLFGSPAGVVCDDARLSSNGMSGLSPSFLGQEMLHGYSLGHARTDGSTDDYTDETDIMSTASASMTPHTVFKDLDVRANPVFLMGPGLNAASMDALGWLDLARVWSNSARNSNASIRLRPLHRRDLPGFLAARIGQYYVEFRDKALWDAGLTSPMVVVHRFDDAHSYAMIDNAGSKEFNAGDSFGNISPPLPHLNFGGVLRIEVETIDPNEKFADIRLIVEPGLEVPTIGIQTSIGAIAQGGGGVVILPGGSVHIVPPESPLLSVINHIATFENSAVFPSLALGQQVRRDALQRIVRVAQTHLDSAAEIKQPNAPLRGPAPQSEDETG